MNTHSPNALTQQPFSILPLKDALLKNLASLDYEMMTPIQMQSLPLLLNQQDILAQAKTGSGKTLAFGLSILNQLQMNQYDVQSLILCPTRELAEQVSQVLRSLARLLPNVKILNLSGGLPMKPQLDSLKHKAHIIVGTPGRVEKHLEKESLNLKKLNTLVLDEADRMLDLGFLDSIKRIMAFCPKNRQTLLFSATYTDEIKLLARQFMQNPSQISIETAPEEKNIQECFYEVPSDSYKFPLLKNLLLHLQAFPTLIFCNTKQQTTELVRLLKKAGFCAAALHGDMEQIDRDLATICFANQSLSILVATDVAARGLDIKELPLVINYDLAFEKDVHTHRIGRTGRAGHKGLALSFTTSADKTRICALESTLEASIPWGKMSEIPQAQTTPLLPKMITLCISAGKKEKIRAGDILGALTKDAELPSQSIGKINISLFYAYVAISHHQIDRAYQHFQNGKLKGRKVNVKKIVL